MSIIIDHNYCLLVISYLFMSVLRKKISRWYGAAELFFFLAKYVFVQVLFLTPIFNCSCFPIFLNDIEQGFPTFFRSWPPLVQTLNLWPPSTVSQKIKFFICFRSSHIFYVNFTTYEDIFFWSVIKVKILENCEQIDHNPKNKNRKIDFSLVSAHCGTFPN